MFDIFHSKREAEGISETLYDVHLTGAREDAFRNPVQVYERLAALGAEAGKSGDFKPTNQQQEVFETLKTKLSAVFMRYAALEKSASNILQLMDGARRLKP